MKNLKIREYAVISFVVLGLLAFAYEKKIEPKVHTVKAEADGFNGNVVLEVKGYKTAKGEIRYVSINATHVDTESIADPAIANLINQVMSKQNLELDAVSGASFTSKGFIDAMKIAEEELKKIK